MTVNTLGPTASRQGCRYAKEAADSHEFDFRALDIDELEDCSTDVPCLCAKIRPGEYVKETECSGVYENITTRWECTIAVHHLAESSIVSDVTNGKCEHGGKSVCKCANILNVIIQLSLVCIMGYYARVG